MKQYRGVRAEHGDAVTMVDGEDNRGLDPRHDLRDPGAAGYGWGEDAGDGPAQLALALCADALGDADRAVAVAPAFEDRVVALLPADGWVLSAREVVAHVEAIEREQLNLATPIPRTNALTRRLAAHLTDLAAQTPTDGTDRLAVMRERGWLEAVRHLAARGGLSHAGRAEAEQLLAASRDWLGEQADSPVVGHRR